MWVLLNVAALISVENVFTQTTFEDDLDPFHLHYLGPEPSCRTRTTLTRAQKNSKANVLGLGDFKSFFFAFQSISWGST